MNEQADQPPQDDIVDVEEYLAAGKQVPPGKKYRIRIDKERYVVKVEEMTGREILALAGKAPPKFLLRQKTKGGVEEIGPDQVVSFVRAGVERFMTIPNEVTEGDATTPRRQFDLLEADAAFLDGLGLRWEAIVENQVKAVIIHDWPIPGGYNVQVTDVHVRLLDGYPDTQIDMAYFSPALARADGKSVNGLSTLTFDGRAWQQWSRHRTAASQWRIGEDDLSTHMAVVREWLIAELVK